jgi:hypothetical protein
MKTALFSVGIGTAIAFAAFAPDAVAQEVTIKTACSIVGDAAPEPLGDRDGHAYSVETDTCLDQTGPFVGGVYTGTVIWEWNGPNAVLVSGSGVMRKPGATALAQFTEGKVELTLTDGKVTGATASGKGRWPIATGSAASLAGKTFTWASKGTGPATFAVEVNAQ